jgi:serine protease Do
MRRWIAVFLLPLGCSVQEPVSDQVDPEPVSQPVAVVEAIAPKPHAPATFADVVEIARPGVVNIYTRTRVKVRRPMFLAPGMVPEERLSESLGSGFVIDPSGLVLTNHHVIGGATEIEVRLFDERRFKARVVGDDPKTDLALLQLEESDNLPVLQMADSDALRVGDWVVAIGNPLGLTSTVTAGIVSATGRKQIPLADLRYQDFIQTDASINPGNSGGPLINMVGQVVGINTAVNAGAQGIGFAIPINMVRELLPRLKEGRVERSWLGIYVDEVPERVGKELGLGSGGALVTKVVRGGPADTAQLKPGDIILSIEDTPILNAGELAWKASNLGVGSNARVKVQRGSEQAEISVRMGAQPD